MKAFNFVANMALIILGFEDGWSIVLSRSGRDNSLLVSKAGT